MNCDCPRATGIVHYEECPLHESHSCPACETENHGNQLIAKQRGAEVLAACIKRQCSFCRDGHVPIEEDGTWLHRVKESGAVVTCDAARLRNLQPAASDLEALLREARLDEARWWEHLSQESHEQHPPYDDCMYCARIAELKKARASLGASK